MLARADPFHRAVGDRDRRHAGRRADALLRARVGEVDSPGVEVEPDAAERGDAVGHQQHVATAQLLAELGERVLDAGRCLGVDDDEQARIGVRVERLEQAVIGDVLAPVGIDLDDVGALTLGDLDDPPAEEAVDGDDRRVARLEQMVEPALHSRGAGRLQRQHQAAARAVGGAQQRDQLGLDLEQIGIHVAEQRSLHRGQRGGGGIARSGAAEQALGRVKRGRGGHRRLSCARSSETRGSLRHEYRMNKFIQNRLRFERATRSTAKAMSPTSDAAAPLRARRSRAATSGCSRRRPGSGPTS